MADGEATTTRSATVTLNLFQGPFRVLSGAWLRRQIGQVSSSPLRTGRGARWTLKQVQGDDVCWVGLP